jgi:hypothetical protein
MRTLFRFRRWIAAYALLAAAWAGAGAVMAGGWPGVDSAQPLVQAPRVCSPNIVPIDRKCTVLAFEPLGTFDGRAWYYAFYATHWADRHGHQNRGFPVFMYLEKPATLRLGLWVNDAPGLNGRWAWTRPTPPPAIFRQEDEVYLGLTLKNVGKTPDQRLFRLTGIRWHQINVLYRSDADEELIDKTTPRGCSLNGDGVFDWTGRAVTWPLSADLTGGDCGSLAASFIVKGDGLALTSAKVVH